MNYRSFIVSIAAAATFAAVGVFAGGVASAAPASTMEKEAAASNGTVVEGNTTIEFGAAATNHDINASELNAFGRVKSNDPAAVAQLSRDPKLVNDSRFVQQHPALQNFLETYPGAKAQIVSNPGQLLPPPTAKGWPKSSH